MASEERINSAAGLLIIEVAHSNPNGDPDNNDYPRETSEGIGIITDVSVKKKLRNMIRNKESVMWHSLKTGCKLDESRFNVLEDPTIDVNEKFKQAENPDEFHNSYWDARVFGYCLLRDPNNSSKKSKKSQKSKNDSTDSTKKNNQFVRTGCVVFGYGRSVAPINVLTHTLTREAPTEDDKNSGMAPEGRKVVEHAIYYMPFFIDANDAMTTSCSKEDIRVLISMLPHIYKFNKSTARPEIHVKHAYYWEWKHPLGGNDCEIINSLKPTKKEDPDTPSHSIDEYDMKSLNNPTINKYRNELLKIVDLAH